MDAVGCDTPQSTTATRVALTFLQLANHGMIEAAKVTVTKASVAKCFGVFQAFSFD